MHFLISIFEHANAIEDKLNSREVRENRVRKPYGWNSVELKLCNVVQKQVEYEENGLTVRSPLRHRLTKRETTTRTPVMNDTFKVKSSGMLQDNLGRWGHPEW
jgi:hypothetical protein